MTILWDSQKIRFNRVVLENSFFICNVCSIKDLISGNQQHLYTSELLGILKI